MLFNDKKKQFMDSISISCPYCKTPIHLRMQSLIESGKDINLQIEALQEKLLQCTCPSCRNPIPVNMPMAYKDDESRTMVFYHPPQESERLLKERILACLPSGIFSNWKVRVVSDRKSFYEKIRILDYRLDDRLVEIMKARIIVEMTANHSEDLQEIYFTSNQKEEPAFETLISHVKGFFPFSWAEYDSWKEGIPILEENSDYFRNSQQDVGIEWALRAISVIQQALRDEDPEFDSQFPEAPAGFTFGA